MFVTNVFLKADKDEARKLNFCFCRCRKVQSCLTVDGVVSFSEQLAAQVCVKCMWDEPRLYSERPPMYVLWKLRDTSTSQLGSSLKNVVTKS